MDEPERKRRGPLRWLANRSRWFWIVVALSLPMLYVASFGPACWCAARMPILATPTACVYWPLTKAAKAALLRSHLHAYGEMGSRGNADSTIITKIVRFTR